MSVIGESGIIIIIVSSSSSPFSLGNNWVTWKLLISGSVRM